MPFSPTKNFGRLLVLVLEAWYSLGQLLQTYAGCLRGCLRDSDSNGVYTWSSTLILGVMFTTMHSDRMTFAPDHPGVFPPRQGLRCTPGPWASDSHAAQQACQAWRRLEQHASRLVPLKGTPQRAACKLQQTDTLCVRPVYIPCYVTHSFFFK